MLSAQQQRQQRNLADAVASRPDRDSNRSRGKTRGRGRGGKSTTTTRREDPKLVATQVALLLFREYGLTERDNIDEWSIGDIDMKRGLAQIQVNRRKDAVHSTKLDKLHGTIFDYVNRELVAFNLGFIPETVMDEIVLDRDRNVVNFTFGEQRVSYPVDANDDAIIVQRGYEGLLCIAYQHKKQVIIGNRQRIELGSGYVGESRRYSAILEATGIDFNSWFDGRSPSTVFYFMLVTGDLLIGSRQFVPEDEQYIVYLGSRDMTDLTSPLNSVRPDFVSSLPLPARIQTTGIYPVQSFPSFADANSFFVNGYEGQQRIARSGWLHARTNQTSVQYAKLVPSKTISLLAPEHFAQIAKTIFENYLDRSETPLEEQKLFITKLAEKQLSGYDYGVDEDLTQRIFEDLFTMPDLDPHGFENIFTDANLALLYKFICFAEMASVEFLNELPKVTSIQPEFRNSESVVVYMRHTVNGIPTYSLVHVYSTGMNYRRRIFEQSQNRLLSTYLTQYRKLVLQPMQISEFFKVKPEHDPLLRFDVCTMDPIVDVDFSLLAKTIIRDSLPEGRQNVRMEEFDKSILQTVEKFIIDKAKGIVPALRDKPTKFAGDADNQERWINKLVSTYRSDKGAARLSSKINSMSFLDVITLYYYINSIYVSFKSDVLDM